ncbi:MAG: branched-chain amino acid ABC transporter permease [Acidisphaera sp.]|nr:branched-chain amino acid ABC transporter permease [Acidisphaera sp.]
MQGYLTAVGTVGGIYALLALGLNLQYGFTGLINFGVVAFYAVGAYTSALLALRGVPFVLDFAAAAVLAALFAWPLGVMCLRLRDDYLAIVTLAFAEILRTVIVSEEWLTNGTRGIPGIPRPFSGLGAAAGGFAYLALVLAAMLAGVSLTVRLVGSPFGRLIQAIRDDEDAVRSVGKSPARCKLVVFMIGAGLTGLAGALYAHYLTYISPDQFVPLLTFYVWIAVIMGGAGRVGGAIAGAALLTLFLEGSRFLRDVLPFVSEVQMASLRLAAIGLMLILFTLYRPQGLLGRVAR